MRIVVQEFINLTPRRGLYRIWEAVSDGGQTRLAAHWVNLNVDEKQSPQEAEENECDVPRQSWLGIYVRFA